MKKIFLAVILTAHVYTLVPQESRNVLPLQKTGFPYPFSALVSSAISLSSTSEHAHTGIILPESFLTKFEAVLPEFQTADYPVILFFSKTADSTLMNFIHAYYPHLQFLLIVNFSTDSKILFDRITMTKTSLLLISFFDQKGEKTQFKLIDSFFYARTSGNLGLETLNISLPETYASDAVFWNSLFVLLKKTSVTLNRVYLLPILVWLAPIQADFLYIIMSLFFLINLIVYRIRIRSRLEFLIFFITMTLTFVMLWYSLVITFYLLTLLLLKQIAGSSKFRNIIVLYPLIFWGMVVNHDKILFSIPAEILPNILIACFIFLSSIVIILIPPAAKKSIRSQDSSR